MEGQRDSEAQIEVCLCASVHGKTKTVRHRLRCACVHGMTETVRHRVRCVTVCLCAWKDGGSEAQTVCMERDRQ